MIKRHTDFQDMMNVSIETEDKWLNRKLNSHICYGKGGGGGGGNQQQDVPPTLRPYVTDVLNRAKALYGAETQYIPYEGERVVPFTAEELAAQEGITGMVGRGISQDPFLSSAGSYYAPAYGLLGEAGALQAGAAREITADEIMGRMSPYQQAVTDITKREAMKEAQLYGQKLKGQAATTGGFGGSRQAILEAQAASDLGGRLADIQAKGQQEAYMNALAMAEQQRAREMGAGQALSGLSGMYSGLGQQALGQAYRELGYLSGVGEAQRGMGQQRADLAYEEFIKQREYPTEQLQKYSSLIQGFPFQFTMPGAQPSQFQQVAGGALTLGGLGRGLGFFNKGGQLNKDGEKYPNAGIAALAKERPDVVSKMGYNEGGTVRANVGGGLLRLYNEPRLAELLASPYESKKEEQLKALRQQQGMAAAQAGLGILAADPSRGALAAIGQGAAPALGKLAEIQSEMAAVETGEQEAELKDLLTKATIAETLAKGYADLSADSDIGDTLLKDIANRAAIRYGAMFNEDGELVNMKTNQPMDEKTSRIILGEGANAIRVAKRSGKYEDALTYLSGLGSTSVKGEPQTEEEDEDKTNLNELLKNM